MTLGELIDHVLLHMGCESGEAMQIANTLWQGDRDYTDSEIEYVAASLGIDRPGDEPVQTEPSTPMPEMTMDPADVLRQVYLACPRLVPADEDGKVHIPRIGRAPQEEQHAIPEEFLAGLPEHVKVLLLSVNIIDGTMTPVFYDEANGVDRALGSIDLTRFSTPEQLNAALDVLLKRLPRVLASDWN